MLGIFIFAFIINQISGNRGLFPLDSASHFDNGFRILNGEHPVKDFWIISGFIVDYMQSLLFLIFGAHWQIYVAHASLVNGLFSVFLLFFFRLIGLNFFYSVIVCLSFSILAYPSSGTPFVDHHSSFFSLASIICLILAIKKQNKLFWFLIPIFIMLASLSKAVPTAYFIVMEIIILTVYIFKKKDFTCIKYLSISSLISLIILFFILLINGIDINDFLIQNFIYPQTIGTERFENFLNTNFLRIITQYKFIFLLNIILLFSLLIKKSHKNHPSKEEILIFISMTLIFIFHQALTKNQIFINFLLPLQVGYILLFLQEKKNINYILIFFLLVLTYKYHIRFNQERKFHELNYVNFDSAVPASKIDKKLAGLKWITPEYPDKPNFEIQKILNIKKILEKEENFVLMSNYSFFSVILEKETNTPTRWFTFDGTDFPRGKNKFKKMYIKLFKRIIKENNINKIFIIKPVTLDDVYNYLNKECFKEYNISNKMKKLEILNCDKI